MINETHDPNLKSWVPGANEPGSDFPIQNLPLGAISTGANHILVVAIGDYAMDLQAAANMKLLPGVPDDILSACTEPSLNRLMSLGPDASRLLRHSLSKIFRTDATERQALGKLLLSRNDIHMVVPVKIGDYTDFYTSIHHAINAGRLFRPDNPLYPNFKHLPVGYHGRASSIVVSGQPCHRPFGQIIPSAGADPEFSSSRKLDFELELAAYVGRGNTLGQRIRIGQADQHVFGLCLLNDWSARDIQAWEYQPLGPFLGKSFLTTVSPWIVTLEALAPYRTSHVHEKGRSPSLDYLDDSNLPNGASLSIEVEVALQTARMRTEKIEPKILSRADFSDQYWSIFQMLTHHASNGCNLQPGDLFGTGTISGPEPGEEGCLLEITRNGSMPVELPSGEQRRFLEDGDEVIMRARCSRNGYATLGFGECRGQVFPAPRE